ncbi:hypothetical protein A6E01_18870 (plasmid) [Vibrio breoganii]|uniref:Alginate lyase 2 domain-containing protein n=2 Tax=Vibrio TaxID=662 RepID=A0AAN0XZ01_9VIBR|nr:polysaccharide lyase family 7 protein [Vibrio breoganii]ANO35280.1 hypothetical protein A6E01_18870 [Vibrio breoganii]
MEYRKLLLALMVAGLLGCGGGGSGGGGDLGSGDDVEDTVPELPDDENEEPTDPPEGPTEPPEEPSEPDDEIGAVAGWDINQWKITLPVSESYYKEHFGVGSDLNDRDSAAELIPADCAGKDTLTADTTLPYYVSHEGGRTHFIADLGDAGVATTTNTKYTRSELRGLYHYDTESRCSASAQNWAIPDKANHNLSATLRVEQYPNVSEPKVIVGQVHGYRIKQALIKLQWDGPSKDFRAIINNDFELDDQLCDASKCQPYSLRFEEVPAYEDFNYEIDVNATGIAITVNGVTQSVAWGERIESGEAMSVLNPAWADATNEYYFKAGIYPQIEPELNSGHVFDVSFSRIELTHE